MRRYRFQITAFTASAVVLLIEILGFNVVGAYFGTALVVQSNILGVVLLALALGYFRGGSVAPEKEASYVQTTLVKTAWIIIATFAFRDLLGGIARALIPTPSIGSLLFAILLFGPLSYYLGTLLPFLVGIATRGRAPVGTTIGTLYFFSGLGSIAGALLFVFFITPFIGTTATIFCAVGSLLFCAALFNERPKRLLACGLIAAALFASGSQIWFDYYPKGEVSFDGNLRVDRNSLRRIDDASTPYARVQVYEGTELNSGKTIRFLKINRETHSGTFLDSNELVFQYAKYNRLGGHFNPTAQKALLIGGGGYSYANYFLGDTPLFDKERIWSFRGALYNNKKTISLPLLTSADPYARSEKPVQVFEAPTFDSERAAIESAANSIIAHSQAPRDTVIIDTARIHETGFADKRGYVHVHEVTKNGRPGAVISNNVPLAPHLIIGHSEIFSGEKKNIEVPLERPAKEGEVLYAMLHRDNGNGHFDPILVDAYEQIERLDVVEIDPQTTAFAEQYFHLNKSDPRLRIFHEDGRTYLNRTQETYDIIYVDAFRSFYSIPYQLTTQEAVRRMYDALEEGGVVVANIPAALSGKNGAFFASQYKTFKSVFPAIKIFASADPKRADIIQNIILVAFKNAQAIRTTPNDDDEINKQLRNEWKGVPSADAPLLTDDFAPVDYLINKFADIETF